MFGKMTLCAAAVSALVLGAAAEAQAVSLVDVTWDGSTPTAQYAYNYMSSGSLVTTGSVVEGGGADGTNGYVVVTDSTNAPTGGGSYWGVAGTIEHNTIYDLSGVTSAADLTYSIDVFVAGYSETRTSPIGLRLEISFIDNGATLYRGRISPSWDVLTGGFQTFSGDFSMLVAQGGTVLQTAIDANKPLRVKFATEIPSGGQLGNGPDRILAIDNVQVFAPAPVPEPTSLAFVGLVAGGLLRRSRR